MLNTTNDFKELYQKMHILTQPVRLQIINTLNRAGKPMYIKQIAGSITDVARRTVSFHLMTLAEHGFVEGEYKEIVPPNSPKGKAAKFYHLTNKVDETFNEFASIYRK